MKRSLCLIMEAEIVNAFLSANSEDPDPMFWDRQTRESSVYLDQTLSLSVPCFLFSY